MDSLVCQVQYMLESEKDNYKKHQDLDTGK